VYGGFTMRHTPCPECGESVAKTELDGHVCERERWLDYQLFQQRGEVEALEEEYRAYLDSPAGRFAIWYAARRRRQPG
jgi:surface antigen